MGGKFNLLSIWFSPLLAWDRQRKIEGMEEHGVLVRADNAATILQVQELGHIRIK